MLRLQIQGCIVVLATTLFCHCVNAEDPARAVDEKLLVKLQGVWIPVSSVIDGKKQDDSILKDRSPSYVFTEDTMLIRLEDRVAGRFKITHLVARGPLWHMDYSGQDNLGAPIVIKGLVKLEGDKLTTCSVLPPGSDRPSELSSKPGSKQMLGVLERRKQKPTEPDNAADDD
jgi:uncharacterized protein (TIGR03067 family)